jgi:hypothetical protein
MSRSRHHRPSLLSVEGRVPSRLMDTLRESGSSFSVIEYGGRDFLVWFASDHGSPSEGVRRAVAQHRRAIVRSIRDL